MTLPQTLSRPPETPLQRAIVARLRGSGALTALLAPVKDSNPAVPAVIDEVPEGQRFPYVRVGEHLSIPDNDLTSFGRQVTVTLHVWTKAGSMGPGQAIADVVVGLLDHQDRALTALLTPYGFRCVRIDHQFAQALDDPDPAIRHHVVRFRVEISQLT
jgi:hypothetical protein